MIFNKINISHINNFISIVGEKNVSIEKEILDKYSKDETEDLTFIPEVVIKPVTAVEVSLILKLCNKEKIPLTPRGAGTGLSGGALPVCGGVLLSMERFNRIIKIDEKNFQATVEPGVINEVFQIAVKEKGLFYPPDPASKGSCFLGGNIAESSGGPKAAKYGVTKDYILNLEVVTGAGEIIWTGANTLKNATGYNLTQLMIGSEGTLGIVTKIVTKLIPLPKNNISLLIPFYSEEEACEAVATIFMNGINPSALEFMEIDALLWTIERLELNLKIPDNIKAHLLIEVDGNDLDLLYKECEKISVALEKFKTGEILLADTAAQKDELWKLRRSVAECVKSHSVYKEEDTVVPRGHLPQLLKGVKEIGNKYGFRSICYGHAGDGNLHVNIIKGNLSDDDWENILPKGIREIFELCKSLGGTISGEHGIGLTQKKYLDIVFSPYHIELLRGIKKVFDPNGILNPGKIF